MKKILSFILFSACLFHANAQTSDIIHHGTFKKHKLAMSSNSYKPDEWEKPYFDSSIRSAFPSDLIKHPEKYTDKLIHLIGIVDSVYIDSSKNITVLLENKFWDYIEDYSIQDEKMFVSEKGDGKFLVTLPDIGTGQFEALQKFPAENKLFLVYGNFKGLTNNLPVLSAAQIKYIDYEFYSTKIFSYEVERNKDGEIVTDKNGKPKLTNLKFLKVAKAGQNK
ncbi:MAG: hypothetical protein QM802_09675 [Agriterribacter sp.]